MWERLRSMWTIPDLRNKILFTLGMLLVFRLVAHVPVPGIDPQSLQAALGKNPQYNQLFGLLDVFSGGSLQTFSVAALGVYPYITASIVMQLIVPIFPRLEAIQREGGEAGRTRISQYTRVMTVPLAFLQAFGQSAIFVQLGAISAGQFSLFNASTFLPTLATLVTLTAGTVFLVWLGEVITENGIGNGISLIIFAYRHSSAARCRDVAHQHQRRWGDEHDKHRANCGLPGGCGLDHPVDCLYLPGSTACPGAVPDEADGRAGSLCWFEPDVLYSYSSQHGRDDSVDLCSIDVDLSGHPVVVSGF